MAAKSKSIGEQIAEKRKKKGLSQNDLAKLVGVGRMSIAHYEQGFRNPSLEVLEKIARALDCFILIKLMNKYS